MFLLQSAAERKVTTPPQEAAIRKPSLPLRKMIVYPGIAAFLVVVSAGWQSPRDKAKTTPTRNATSLPKKGLATSSPDVVVLSTNRLNSKTPPTNGLLFREIVRQATG